MTKCRRIYSGKPLLSERPQRETTTRRFLSNVCGYGGQVSQWYHYKIILINLTQKQYHPVRALLPKYRGRLKEYTAEEERFLWITLCVVVYRRPHHRGRRRYFLVVGLPGLRQTGSKALFCKCWYLLHNIHESQSPTLVAIECSVLLLLSYLYVKAPCCTLWWRLAVHFVEPR